MVGHSRVHSTIFPWLETVKRAPKPCQTFPKSPVPAPWAQKPHFISQKCPWEQQYHQYHPFETPQVQNKSLCTGREVEMWLKPCLLFRKVPFQPSWAKKPYQSEMSLSAAILSIQPISDTLGANQVVLWWQGRWNMAETPFSRKVPFHHLEPNNPTVSVRNVSFQPCKPKKSQLSTMHGWKVQNILHTNMATKSKPRDNGYFLKSHLEMPLMVTLFMATLPQQVNFSSQLWGRFSHFCRLLALTIHQFYSCILSSKHFQRKISQRLSFIHFL